MVLVGALGAVDGGDGVLLDARLADSTKAMSIDPESGAPIRVLVWSPRAELVQMLKTSLAERGLRTPGDV